ncbi:sigma factor-like helix-turn-helix DNA-binding protein [Actinosynnema sp. NPDC050436]|uniref:sigma factor-like helix-turn-helix DNA-binding protein n=1 Tax=Actinosynnema sp. NPDC050436 TaxID=3155659 RepID=UPI0033CD381A
MAAAFRYHVPITGIDPPVADLAGAYDERDAMLRRIARLPRKQRAAVVLRYYEGCADADVAAALGCSEGTVRTHISRAPATLRAAERVREALWTTSRT